MNTTIVNYNEQKVVASSKQTLTHDSKNPLISLIKNINQNILKPYNNLIRKALIMF